jgi:hypothetical protein
MQAHPFSLVGQGTLRSIQATLTRAATVWAAEWGVAPEQLKVSVERAWEGAPVAAGPVWRHSAQAGGRGAWFGCSAEFDTELQQAIFGLPEAEPANLAPTGARQALEALLDALAGAALAGQQSVTRNLAIEVPAGTLRRGGGAVVAQIACGRQHCWVLLDSAAVRALHLPPAALPALAPVDYRASVAMTPVALQLRIGAAKVGLGSLLSLSVGDVIRLDARHDAPVALRTLAGSVLLDAYLGRSGDSVAVELVQRLSAGLPSLNYGAAR